jgi:hypothetical protein
MVETLWNANKFGSDEDVTGIQLLKVLVIIIWIWTLIGMWSKYIDRLSWEWVGFNPSSFKQNSFVVFGLTILFFFFVHFTGSAVILEEDV